MLTAAANASLFSVQGDPEVSNDEMGRLWSHIGEDGAELRLTHHDRRLFISLVIDSPDFPVEKKEVFSAAANVRLFAPQNHPRQERNQNKLTENVQTQRQRVAGMHRAGDEGMPALEDGRRGPCTDVWNHGLINNGWGCKCNSHLQNGIIVRAQLEDTLNFRLCIPDERVWGWMEGGVDAIRRIRFRSIIEQRVAARSVLRSKSTH